MTDMERQMSRRGALVLAAAGLAAARAAPARPDARDVAFAVWRNGRRIGRHSVRFSGGGADFTATIEAIFAVSLGPIPLVRYRHQATETWRGGDFAQIASHTVTNGRQESLLARRTAAGVSVSTAAGERRLAAEALPLTHWNPRALSGPLFNPETGETMLERVSREADQAARLADGRTVVATRYDLVGDADLADWYDLAGRWAALSAKARDGSTVEYRRIFPT